MCKKCSMVLPEIMHPGINNSAGYLKRSDLRGRVFGTQAVASRSSCVKPLKSMPLVSRAVGFRLDDP